MDEERREENNILKFSIVNIRDYAVLEAVTINSLIASCVAYVGCRVKFVPAPERAEIQNIPREFSNLLYA